MNLVEPFNTKSVEQIPISSFPDIANVLQYRRDHRTHSGRRAGGSSAQLSPLVWTGLDIWR